LKQVAEELGVRYVVEGSVRKDGDLVRITAQLNDATTGSHVWAHHYDRDITNVFAVQDEITDAIVATIEPKIYVAVTAEPARSVLGDLLRCRGLCAVCRKELP
jgi:TolB-like protein